MTLTAAPVRNQSSISTKQTDTYTVAIVRVAAPWYAPNWLIARQFSKYIGEYERLAGLERKLYTIGEDRHYGGIYLWSSRQAAETFYSPQWADAIQQRRGSAPDLRLWQAPTIIEGTATLPAKPLSTRSSAYPALATLTVFNTTVGNALENLKHLHSVTNGLVRSYFLQRDEDQVGVIDLWESERVAQQFFAENWLKVAEAQLGKVHRETFKVPVLMSPAS